ncbi:hypothetical protein ACHAWF_007409 [Thalassiosira exigua]
MGGRSDLRARLGFAASPSPSSSKFCAISEEKTSRMSGSGSSPSYIGGHKTKINKRSFISVPTYRYETALASGGAE